MYYSSQHKLLRMHVDDAVLMFIWHWVGEDVTKAHSGERAVRDLAKQTAAQVGSL